MSAESSGENVSLNLPLSGMRVIDLCDTKGQSCGRLLADLGAEVILLEPRSGLKARSVPPLHNSESISFAARNANKRSVCLDENTENAKDTFLNILASSDLVLDSGESRFWSAFSLNFEDLSQRFPSLILLSITDFGLQGEYKDFSANEIVHLALGMVLSRSGRSDREPLLPPGKLAYETSSIQATWVALVAYWNKLKNGCGDVLDFSINDAVAQILDPGVGASGSASAGKTAIETAPHGRPEVEFVPGKMPSVALFYPVYKCADGYIRICVLNPRQWKAMSEWLGKDHPYTDKKYQVSTNRLIKLQGISKLQEKLFADKNMSDLVVEGQKRGIPIAAINKPAQLFGDEHFLQRGLFSPIAVGGGEGKIPSGYARIDGQRIGLRRAAPTIGEMSIDELDIRSANANAQNKTADTSSAEKGPLHGLTVLDLGVIVAGAELGRLFADQGALVIKVENKKYGDGLRQSLDGNPVPISFALGNRNKQSFGVNLRSEEGKSIFYELVKKADVVISNFRPGTTESLGLAFDDLSKINPRIICAESSAMGSFGSQAKTMGYGPLVRSTTGLTGLWRYADDERGFGDAVTIFPDHFAARVSANFILAKLIEREKTGRGGFVDLSQAETIINALAPDFLRESLQPGSLISRGNRSEFHAPSNIYQCAGDDQWCAISVESDEQWLAFTKIIGREELSKHEDYATEQSRIKNADALDAIVAEWARKNTSDVAMTLCQERGISAGKMMRLSDFLDNPHYQSRNFFRELNQPSAGRIVETENNIVGFSKNLKQPDIKQAPIAAEHTRDIARDLLGLNDEEIDSFIEQGHLEQNKIIINPKKLRRKARLVTIATTLFFKYYGLKSRLGL